MPGKVRRDDFGNSQKSVRLIDTGEILHELEKDLIRLDEGEFGEETLPVGCCAIQVVGLLPRTEEAHFSKESRKKLSELIEFNHSVAEIDILGAIENTIFVEDITLSGKISLVRELTKCDLIRIGEEEKKDVFDVLDFVRNAKEKETLEVEQNPEAENSGPEIPESPDIPYPDPDDRVIEDLDRRYDRRYDDKGKERNGTGLNSTGSTEDDYEINIKALPPKVEEGDFGNVSDFEIVEAATVDSVDARITDYLSDKESDVPTRVKQSLAKMIGIEAGAKELILKLVEESLEEEEAAKFLAKNTPILDELFGHCDQSEFDTDPTDESPEGALYSFKHGVYLIITPLLGKVNDFRADFSTRHPVY